MEKPCCKPATWPLHWLAVESQVHCVGCMMDSDVDFSQNIEPLEIGVIKKVVGRV